eukprot:510722_1
MDTILTLDRLFHFKVMGMDNEFEREFRFLMKINCIPEEDLDKFGNGNEIQCALNFMTVGTVRQELYVMAVATLERLSDHHDGAEHVINIVKDIANKNIMKCSNTKKVDYLLGKCYDSHGK